MRGQLVGKKYVEVLYYINPITLLTYKLGGFIINHLDQQCNSMSRGIPSATDRKNMLAPGRLSAH